VRKPAFLEPAIPSKIETDTITIPYLKEKSKFFDRTFYLYFDCRALSPRTATKECELLTC